MKPKDGGVDGFLPYKTFPADIIWAAINTTADKIQHRRNI